MVRVCCVFIRVVVPVSPPSKDVRGDGLTFVFRLDGNATVAYRWTQHVSGDGSVVQGGHVATDSATRTSLSTVDQFIVAAHGYLAVGGGSAEGSNALRLDEDLSTCFAGPSDTFRNPPLAPEEQLQPFSIGEGGRERHGCTVHIMLLEVLSTMHGECLLLLGFHERLCCVVLCCICWLCCVV